ncbi:MAG: hypothetical protein KC621_23245 [Myxococcales bacterium]|nr:hypothetical protein [Myxococcales bacterium]
MAALLPMLLLGACEIPQDVILTGVVWDGVGDTVTSLPDAEVTVLDALGEPLGSTTANAEGSFGLTVQGGDAAFVVIRRDGYATSSFPGVLGIGEQRVEDHTLYALPLEQVEQERATYVGCPGADASTAISFGEVRIFDIVDDVTGEHPSVGTATITVIGERATDDRDACYLDAFGERWEPRRTATGPTGRFAAFDLAPGLHRIQVDYTGVGWSDQLSYLMWIPDDPVSIAPWFPVWVEFLF